MLQTFTKIQKDSLESILIKVYSLQIDIDLVLYTMSLSDSMSLYERTRMNMLIEMGNAVDELIKELHSQLNHSESNK